MAMVLPLGFNPNKQVIHNICLILTKSLDARSVRLFDDGENRVLLEITLLMIQQWISEYVDNDAFILASVVELVEILIYSERFWT